MPEHPQPARRCRLIINADDYAMSAPVDAAIVHLAEMGIVTSTSAMVLSPRWPSASASLRHLPLDCGLHLDFTSEFAQAAGCGWTLPALIIRCYSGRIDHTHLRASIHRQLDQFETHSSCPPRFIDGHQHVHQLPVVRELLMQALQERYGPSRHMAVRQCTPSRWRGAKAAVIAQLGGKDLSHLARQQQYFTNTDFVGVYSFAHTSALATLWDKWLSNLQGEWPLAMCHVASPSKAQSPPATDAVHDAIFAQRLSEYAWLASAEFQRLCAHHSIVPSRWPAA